MSFEYSQENQKIEFEVEYDGEIDPLQERDDISIKLLGNATDKCVYSINNGKNHIEGSI